jgi:acetyl-CoA carboxylase biotin carboxyl carrier protein
MNFKPYEIRELIRLIDESQIDEFELEFEGNKIYMKKSGTNSGVSATLTTSEPAAQAAPVQAVPTPKAVVPEPVAAPKEQEAQEPSPQAAEEDDPTLHKIVSPMVGTFYRAPAPDADPYVKEGDTIQKDTVVCIVEAMKLMNEIEAEVNGTIVKVLVENGQLVEYGQPLFLVKTT